MRQVPTADRYEVLDFLAEGGMGAIYRGRKRGAGGFEKEVVLKQLRPEYTAQPEFIELFLREARLSAVLDHANIVHTLDLVRTGSDYFMIMEYVRGGDLRILLKRAKKRKKWPTAAAALFIAREVLAALVYAHGRLGIDGQPLGLIHRDVSPSNILVSGAGEVKLTDFGIAKATTHQSTFYRVRGKIGYMSPEQAKSQPLRPRSDVYSVAVILWELLTGERLHVATSITTSAEEMYALAVPSVCKKVPGLPPELDGVLAKGLAVDPEHRYQTAREFMEDLNKVANRHALVFSAHELGRHFVEVCGPVEDWGSVVMRDTTTEVSVTADRGLTEPISDVIGDPSGDDEDLVWVDRLAASTDNAHAVPRGRAPAVPSVTEVTTIEPIEDLLTSRIEAIGPPEVSPRRRWPALAIAAGLAVGAVSIALVMRFGEAEPQRQPAHRIEPPPVAAPLARLSVDSEPTHARVMVDNQVRCETPCTFDTATAVTSITLAKEGFNDWSTVVLRGAEPIKARLRRELPRAASGGVHFKNAPSANVFVGGRPIGYATTAAKPLYLPAGEQPVELVTPTGERTVIKVVVTPGAITDVDVALDSR